MYNLEIFLAETVGVPWKFVPYTPYVVYGAIVVLGLAVTLFGASGIRHEMIVTQRVADAFAVFDAGKAAYKEGKSESDCPHSPDEWIGGFNLREQWISGFWYENNYGVGGRFPFNRQYDVRDAIAAFDKPAQEGLGK